MSRVLWRQKQTWESDFGVRSLLQEKLLLTVEDEDAECSVQQTWTDLMRRDQSCRSSGNASDGGAGTFIDVRVKVAVFLGVRSDPPVVFVDQDAHLREQLDLLLIQVIRGDLRHPGCSLQASHLTDGKNGTI